MAGTLKVELSGATKEELKRQLEAVIRELDKINFRPGNRINLSGPQAWKPAGNLQAWKPAGNLQAWKPAGNPQAGGNLREWKITYET